ncbi:MAG: EAL domain-containing protein [Magnetococcales bacterium]|nr:EAL domain-containing protein [Magnetococcales bacterium]
MNKSLLREGTVGWKISIGFLLVVSLFLFVNWRHHITLDQALKEYQQLRDNVDQQKTIVENIRLGIIAAQNEENKFLLSPRSDALDQFERIIKQALSDLSTLEASGFSNKTSLLQLQTLLTDYQRLFLVITAAWTVKGLDHDSGLQGQFRDAVHKMESMAGRIAEQFPLLGTHLEKNILMLRRREKDYLLRGATKYVTQVQEEIRSLAEYIGASPVKAADITLFNTLLDNYKSGFLALVSQNEKISSITTEIHSNIEKTISPLEMISATALHNMATAMAQLTNKTENHRSSMLLLSGLATLLGIVIALVVSLYSANQHRALAKSASRFRAIMENAVDGIVTIDEKGTMVSVNPALENLFGYNSGDLLGKNIKILMPSPNRENHDGYLARYKKTQIKNIIGGIREVEGICRDGGRFPLELSVSTFDEDGKSFFTGVIHDITERKQAKDALEKAYDELEQRVLERTEDLSEITQQLQAEVIEHKKAESRLRLAAKVFENASEAILITDADARIINVNSAYTTISGFEREDVIGQNPSIGKSGRHDDDFYSALWRKLQADGMWQGEIWDRRKNGEIYPKWLTINVVCNEKDVITNYVGIFSDISHIKATEKNLEQLAFYDPLTKLPNRLLFRDRLIHEFQVSRRYNRNVVVFFIDLDRFKHINDTLGHAAGDQLLIEVSARITECVRKADTVARLGGDEFTVILTEINQTDQIAQIATNIIAALRKVFILEGQDAYIGASIGIAIFPQDGDDFDTLTKNADMAMYKAKESGRGVYRFFKPEMDSQASSRLTLESSMRRALENEEFQLHYQPKLDLVSHKILGMEALARWQNGSSMVSPAQFIPLAEETGLIEPLGLWILQTAIKQTKTWLDAGLPSLTVAVNLSARQFQQPNLIKTIESVLNQNNFSSNHLELEITESIVMQDADLAAKTLKALREMGISISIDDFGTGYSSLSYLKKFPFNTLKIDQSFVRDLTVDSDEAAIVSAIINLARDLGLGVVAEGVETKEQLSFLKKHKCDSIQGYLFSRPLPPEKFSAFMISHQRTKKKSQHLSL